jgi:tellurium resistance protein TerD
MSSLILAKDQSINLTKVSSTRKFTAALGWEIDPSKTVDVDVCALLLDKDGFLLNEASKHVIYFNNRLGSGIELSEDDRKGAHFPGEDCETIKIEMDLTHQDVASIQIFAAIYDAQARGQNFGDVKNAFIRVFETDSKKELCRFNLTENFSGFNVFYAGGFLKAHDQIGFKAIGQGGNGDIQTIANGFERK